MKSSRPYVVEEEFETVGILDENDNLNQEVVPAGTYRVLRRRQGHIIARGLTKCVALKIAAQANRAMTKSRLLMQGYRR